MAFKNREWTLVDCFTSNKSSLCEKEYKICSIQYIERAAMLATLGMTKFPTQALRLDPNQVAWICANDFASAGPSSSIGKAATYHRVRGISTPCPAASSSQP